MKRVAPELESLMWTLAEERNERAIDEFGERHPELRSELLRRIEMVKGLRGAKKKPIEQPKPIPRFVPKEVPSRGPAYVVGGLVLAALCALAFAVTALLTPWPHPQANEPLKQPNPQPVVQNPPQPNPRQGETQSNPIPSQTDPKTDETEKPPKLGTIKIEHAPLFTVLRLMSDECGVDVQHAPGLKNQDVVVDYRDMTAMEMLHDLGKQYGFTPEDQHDGSIIVIPAIDPKDMPMAGTDTGSMPMRKIGG
jgi:hypothetical protein